jgi:hypothetical protein
VVGEEVFFVDGKQGESGRALRCHNLADGSERWQRPVASESSGVLLATAEEVFAQDEPETLSCYALDGKLRWRTKVGAMEVVPAVTETMVLIANQSPSALVVLDRPTGQQLWQVALEAGPPRAAPLVVKERVYLGTAAGLEARSLVTGQQLAGWELVGGGVSGEVLAGPDWFAYVNDAEELILVDRHSGALLRRIAGASKTLTPLVARDALLYFAPGKLMRLSLDSEKEQPREWMDISWLGEITAPAIVHDSNIYLGMRGWGLVRLGKSQN